jgi:hypothetical protein
VTSESSPLRIGWCDRTARESTVLLSSDGASRSYTCPKPTREDLLAQKGRVRDHRPGQIRFADFVARVPIASSEAFSLGTLSETTRG